MVAVEVGQQIALAVGVLEPEAVHHQLRPCNPKPSGTDFDCGLNQIHVAY